MTAVREGVPASARIDSTTRPAPIAEVGGAGLRLLEPNSGEGCCIRRCETSDATLGEGVERISLSGVCTLLIAAVAPVGRGQQLLAGARATLVPTSSCPLSHVLELLLSRPILMTESAAAAAYLPAAE